MESSTQIIFLGFFVAIAIFGALAAAGTIAIRSKQGHSSSRAVDGFRPKGLPTGIQINENQEVLQMTEFGNTFQPSGANLSENGHCFTCGRENAKCTGHN